MVDGGLGHHRVVLELALPQGGGVTSDEDQLCLSAAQSLEGAPVTKDDLRECQFSPSGDPARGRVARTLPDLMTRASLAPMDWASFFFLFGAIATVRWVNASRDEAAKSLWLVVVRSKRKQVDGAQENVPMRVSHGKLGPNYHWLDECGRAGTQQSPKCPTLSSIETPSGWIMKPDW